MTLTPVEIPKPPEPSGARLALTLAFAGLLSGLAIVSVYEATLPIIERNSALALERAVLKVTPGSARMQGLIVGEGGVRVATEGESANVYAAYDEQGEFVGYAIPGEGAGFQDVIKLIYGYDPVGKRVVGMEILESRETPGLGDKIYKDAEFVANFESLAVEPRIVCVKKGESSSPNEVDAITGATISAKAVVKIIQQANERWLAGLPAEAPAMAGGADPQGEPGMRRPPPTPVRESVGDGEGEEDTGGTPVPLREGQGEDGREAQPTESGKGGGDG